jgi:geranylgeranyl diphosphate synthase type I
MTTKDKMEHFKNEFNIHFENEIKNILKEQRNFHLARTDLDEPLKNIVLKYTKGGKRIRPFLIYYFSEYNDVSKVLDICLAVELFHLAALIHDDIMDESGMRRGAQTLHIATQQFAKENHHLGSDIALLLGDVFLTASIAKAALLGPLLFEEFRLMIQRTIRGQYLDSFGMNQILGETSEEEILARHELKTAWYTFCSPARLGYISSINYSKDSLEILTDINCELGLLFQIRDDIIDCTDRDSGKELFGDIIENQTTWVTLYIKKNYPKKFKEILSAKNSHNRALLQVIFEDIDLRTPYEKEFNKRKEMIKNLSNNHNDLKEKVMVVLELLVLK